MAYQQFPQQPYQQFPQQPYQQFPQMRPPMQMPFNNYPNWHPANWAPHYQAGAGIGLVVFIIVVIVLIIYFTSPTTYMSFKPKSTHVSYKPNRPKPKPMLNWIKKHNFNNDDRTADEYYDDRTFARSNKTAYSNNKAKFGLKLPGTNTSYRKFTEKSSY